MSKNDQKKTLNFELISDKFFDQLGVKYAQIGWDDGTDIVKIYSQTQLNRVVGRLAFDEDLDIERVGMPFMRNVREHLIPGTEQIATLIRKYKTQETEGGGIAFKLVHKDDCTDQRPQGYFESPIGAVIIDSFTIALEKIQDSVNRGMPFDVGVRLLKQVLKSDLPLENRETPSITAMLVEILRSR